MDGMDLDVEAQRKRERLERRKREREMEQEGSLEAMMREAEMPPMPTSFSGGFETG